MYIYLLFYIEGVLGQFLAQLTCVFGNMLADKLRAYESTRSYCALLHRFYEGVMLLIHFQGHVY